MELKHSDKYPLGSDIFTLTSLANYINNVEINKEIDKTNFLEKFNELLLLNFKNSKLLGDFVLELKEKRTNILIDLNTVINEYKDQNPDFNETENFIINDLGEFLNTTIAHIDLIIKTLNQSPVTTYLYIIKDEIENLLLRAKIHDIVNSNIALNWTKSPKEFYTLFEECYTKNKINCLKTDKNTKLEYAIALSKAFFIEGRYVKHESILKG